MKALASLLLLLAVNAVSAAEPVSVTVKPLHELWQPQHFNAPAEVLSLNHPEVSAEISATVVEVPVNSGDVVEKGDLLLKLDCEPLLLQQQINQANLERSNAQLEFARNQLARAINLNKKKSISEELLGQRKTELQVALADNVLNEKTLALSLIAVDDCQVTAPFNAVITGRMVSKGDYANTGQALMALVDMTAIEVEAELQTSEIRSLQMAPKVMFEYENKGYELALRTVIPVFDSQTSSARVRLVFKYDELPWPGSEGRLTWQSGLFLLPAEYISRRDKGLGVFLAEGGKAVFSALNGAIEGRPAVVELPAQASIIAEGRHRLKHGDAILVVSGN